MAADTDSKHSSLVCRVTRNRHGVAHLQELLDDFSEEVREAGRVRNAGIGCNGVAQAGPALLVCCNEGVEQQGQPVARKVPQHLHIPAAAPCFTAGGIAVSGTMTAVCGRD